MARPVPKDLAWIELVLEVENPCCGECGRRMHVRSNRHRYLLSFQGRLHLICKLMHCTDSACPNHHRTFGPEWEYESCRKVQPCCWLWTRIGIILTPTK